VPPAEPLPPVGACDADAVRAPERGVRRRFSARAASQRARTSSTASRAFAACGLCLWLLHVLDVSGPLEAYAFPLAGVAALGAVVVGIVRYRPPRVSCWYALGLAVVLFVIGGSLRVVYSTLGNLGATRSLVPDALVLPGYLLLMGGLLGFVFARRFRTSDRGEIMLDAAIASLAVFSCAWVFFIRPLLVHNHVPIPVRFVLIAYPTMSTFLVAVAFHLKFSPGSQRRSLSRWVVVMTMLILVGDILYMLAELHRVTIASQLLDAPYVLAFVVAGAISLHPDMIELSAPRRVADPFRSRARLVIVAGRLAIPAVLFITKVPGSVSDHVVMSVTLFALIGAAAYRIFRALEASMNSEARLSHQATHDLLTGLPNRGLVQHYIEEALGTANLRGLHVAVLFLDLDRFKLVNDTFGHGHGDELLVEVAHRLRSAVRSGDLISRIGGDEFVIVLTDVANLDDAVGLAERVRRSLTEPFRVRDSEIFVTASIGVTLADHASGSAEAEVMIRDADNAMYRAKAQGRNAVAVFDHSMRRQVSERLALEHDLRHALANGELRLHYQPIVELATGRLDGAEALVRWQHPTMGPLPPMKFIPIAEDSGLIIDIGAWVLSEACADLGRWRQVLPDSDHLHVSVNLSTSQMRDAGLIDAVQQALEAAGISGEHLHLEITESLLMEDPLDAIEVLSRLKTLKVRLSIDDFGTGYSSLAYLRQFPVDRVKIDRAFVDLLGDESPADETLVPAIIAMARALKVQTVAEGVETPQQGAALRVLGCDFGQGYLYSRPIPAARAQGELTRLAKLGSRLVTAS